MLVLSRKPNEVIMIGDHIKMYVLGIQGQQIRLGFEAPQEVTIHRLEIFERIQQEKTNDKTLEEN